MNSPPEHRRLDPSKQRPPPANPRRTQSYTHGKYAEELAVGDVSSPNGTELAALPANSDSNTTAVASTSIPSTNTNATVASTSIPNSSTNAPHRPYPLRPSTPQAATSHFLFSDPLSFAPPSLSNRTHYLSPSLRGTLWWDVNSDGKRGDYSNATLNEMEYDYGLSNVANIVLVSCRDEPEKLAVAASSPFNGRDAAALPRSLVDGAGTYEFRDVNTVPSGRYYVVYEAPRGWRLTGNVLPLERRVAEDGTTTAECLPWGGEGGDFSDLAREKGDFDDVGYCARSIGCVEVGSRSELEEKFDRLVLWEETEYYTDVVRGDVDDDLYGMEGLAYTGEKMVALPAPYALDVGLAREEWELDTKQYADATMTLRFPVEKEEETMLLTPLESTLSSVFVDAESFGTSTHRKSVGKVVDEYLKENIVNLGRGGQMNHVKNSQEAIFQLSGLDLFDAKMERKTANKSDATQSSSRYLRASRKAQEEVEVIEITYSFTARGSYNPPPHDQLGYFVENSINADPDHFVRTLRKDATLPFQNLESARSTHLTVGPPAPRPCEGCVGIQAVAAEDSSGMEEWATIPVILVSLMIGALVCFFFGRRIWKRRREVEPHKNTMMGTKDFAIRDIDIQTEKLVPANEDVEEKNRKKKNKKRHERDSSEDDSDKESVSDTSEGSNPNSPYAEEEDSSSSSSSSSEDSEARRRRRRKKRKAKKDSRRKSRGSLETQEDPPTLEDLRREKKKKKKKRTSKTRDLVIE